MRQRDLGLCVLLVFLSGCVLVSAKKKPPASQGMDEQKRALHALNRLTFGPRPGDVDRIAAMGVDKWIEQQLHPEKIDDHAIDGRLAGFTTLRMTTKEMLEKFPPPQVVKQVAEGKKGLPRDPKERAIYESQVDAYRDRQERKQTKGDQDSPSAANADQKAAMRETRMAADSKAEELLDLPPDERFNEILKMPPEERRMLARGLNQDDRQRMMQEFTPQQRETVMAMANPQMVITTELQQAKILRAIYSERQLDEVMTDFWFNHFNVFMGKGPDRYLLTAYERDVIRPHALGKFKDLLNATAKSPAMLFYLDNWLSVGPHSDVATGRQRQRGAGYRPIYRGPFGVPVYRPPRPQNPHPQQQKKNKREGLNENYARELMELHTLSVNGGYNQKDVTEVAKVFTGWTIKQPRQGGGFEFNERMHEPGPKYVLGKVIKEHGEKEGEEVLEMLAKSPKTAHFVSLKLAQRFVSDDPPPALVARMSETFVKKDGDIREVLRAMFRSPEFWSNDAYRAKVKTPLEFVVSAVRASGVDVENAMPLVQNLNRMDMPLYGAQPPTGYAMKAESWVNSSALLNRMNFALALGTGRIRGVNFESERMLPQAKQAPDPIGSLAMLEVSLLGGDVSKNTHDTILKQMNDPQITGVRQNDPARPPNVGILAGLLMGSPEFQRR